MIWQLAVALAVCVQFLGMTVSFSGASDKLIVRNAKRKRIVPKKDRGLPPDETLEEFAKLFIEYVTKLWPEFKGTELLPKDNPETISEMVRSYKHRHRTGIVDVERLAVYAGIVVKLGAMYPRYSDPNSQSKSISDQAFQILNKARTLGCFIPWELVFADYARSATRGHRQGFDSLINVLKGNGNTIDVVLIDDFQRGSRNDRQWWLFAGICKNNDIELYCASDGFNLQDENWEEMLRLNNLITQLEAKLRQRRGNRGLRGVAQRRRVSGKLSLGFARTPELDENGSQVLKPDDTPFMVPCIDPENRKYREKMYELFNEKKWSYYKIAQFYNRAKIDDWSGWTDVGIRSTLANPDAIGVFISNRTSSFKNYETGEWERKLNPRSEWDVYYDPSLAITSIPIWRATKKRIAEISEGSKRRGYQPGRVASTLFSKALVCGYCGKVLTLGRSAGDKYKQLHCSNGRRRRHSCGLTTTKSVTIIEKCLLQYLSDAILTEDNLRRIFARANETLKEEAARPKEDVGPLKAALARCQREKDKLFSRVIKTDDRNLLDAYEAQIATTEKEVKALRKQLRDAEIKNDPPPPPIDLDDLDRYLADLRELLNHETPAAAEALRAITGPISITQTKKPGRKKGGVWIAKFTPDLVKALRNFVQENSYPDSLTMDILSKGKQTTESEQNGVYPDSRTMKFLSNGKWTNADEQDEVYPNYLTLNFLCRKKWVTEQKQTVLLDQISPKHRQAPEMGAKFQAGKSIKQLADAAGLTTERTQELVDYALQGMLPKTDKEKKAIILREIQPDVVRLRDEANRSFSEIQRWFAREKQLRVSRYWIIEAWDNAHPEEIAAAKAEGRRPRRGRFCHHSAATIGKIREHLNVGRFNVAEIARLAGVSEPTVRRQMDVMAAQPAVEA